MWPDSFPLIPQRASELAREVDALFLVSLGILVFFTVSISAVIVYFMLRYRRRSEFEVGQPPKEAIVLEIVWSIIPLAILMCMFVWGTSVFFKAARPPADALEFTVIGKQWMWKIQHPEGNREINELHVPVNQAIKLTMTSEDVVHSFFIPAMRVKRDVIPGRYTTLWFRPDRTGTYHLFCAEYCGAEHSQMIGKVVVMEPQDYEAWLAGGGSGVVETASGEDLFMAKACNTCHREDSAALAPILIGIVGHEVEMTDGSKVLVDNEYLRESILNPSAKIVAGFNPVMPTYQGQLSEEEVLNLITYIRDLSGGSAPHEADATEGN